MVGFYLGPKPDKKHDNSVTDSLELMGSDNDSDLPLASHDEDPLKSDLTGDQERINSRSGDSEADCDSNLEQDEVEDRSDEEGWITPENFQEVCVKMGGGLEEQPTGVAVACITTDFAMQVRSCMLFNCACCKM